jgi:hypothetical protein
MNDGTRVNINESAEDEIEAPNGGLTGHQLFKWRLAHEGKAPPSPARDEYGNVLNSRAIFLQNLRRGAR